MNYLKVNQILKFHSKLIKYKIKQDSYKNLMKILNNASIV